MFRALSLLALVACVSAPAFAGRTPNDRGSTDRASTNRDQTEQRATRTVLSAADYELWQKRGFSRQDIQNAYNAAHASNRSVDDIFGMRRNGRSWEEIARELRITTDRIYRGPMSAVAGERSETNGAGARGRDTGRATGTSDRNAEERVRGRRDTTSVGGSMRGGGGGAIDRDRDDQGHLAGHMGYPVYERPLPGRFYRERLRMTPAEYVRIRNMGFTRDQVFMIANLRWETGLENYVFVDAIWRGEHPLEIARRFDLSRFELTTVRPEWRTAEWAEAVGESRFDRTELRLW